MKSILYLVLVIAISSAQLNKDDYEYFFSPNSKKCEADIQDIKDLYNHAGACLFLEKFFCVAEDLMKMSLLIPKAMFDCLMTFENANTSKRLLELTDYYNNNKSEFSALFK